MLLSAAYGTKLYRRESLIIFDEVQLFPKARQAIKYLVADGRYDYLETGNLISIYENVKDILIPSDERRLKMVPLDFEEFCQAFGEEWLPIYIRNCFSKREPLDRELHNRAMSLAADYMLIGGMPKSVALYLENGRNFEAADRENRRMLELYRSGIREINGGYRDLVISIFHQIPGLLSQHDTLAASSNIQQGASAEQYEDAVFWLADSMIVNECFLCGAPNEGICVNEERGSVRYYMGDTGLLVSHSFDANTLHEGEIYRQLLSGRLSLHHGMLYKNAIA